MYAPKSIFWVRGAGLFFIRFVFQKWEIAKSAYFARFSGYHFKNSNLEEEFLTKSPKIAYF